MESDMTVRLTDVGPVARFIEDVLTLADDHTLTETQLRDGLEHAISKLVGGLS